MNQLHCFYKAWVISFSQILAACYILDTEDEMGTQQCSHHPEQLLRMQMDNLQFSGLFGGLHCGSKTCLRLSVLVGELAYNNCPHQFQSMLKDCINFKAPVFLIVETSAQLDFP